MDFSILGNYSVILGGVSSVFVAILVIFVTHYLRRLYCETTATTNNVSKEFSNKDQAKSEEEILNNLGYSQERLSEIAKYAQILHEYEPPEEIGAGEPSKFNKKQEDGTSGKIFPGIAKYEDLINEADSVNDCDSLTVNLPDEDDQDDIDISDIISDDISIDEDLEDDVDGQISPQAMADIEAEMLDDSILNESFEDQTKPDAVKQNDKDEEPLAKDEDKNVKLTLTEEEIATEKKAQENQLSEIFALMEKNPEMFGMTTKEDIQRQAGLYRQFKSKAPKTP